ncbi:hypothetical protein HPP92_028984 [Vanilla planifolia]|uniref:Uncharacterized protein n=1 Tax=Vanilla planifolia TaxID=51239 RepID=A0A835U2P6_VANPL|nr:hypothetical protein HPP92_028984 [Vanilla planifolia]KAG0446152.1 hypothetical protein HPP92_028973 [Vanilla planifolia]
MPAHRSVMEMIFTQQTMKALNKQSMGKSLKRDISSRCFITLDELGATKTNKNRRKHWQLRVLRQ